MVGFRRLLLRGSQRTLCYRLAQLTIATNLISTFNLIGRKIFDGALIDHSLHNEAFDLYTELQALNVPYLSCNVPHRLQRPGARQRDAKMCAVKLANHMVAEEENLGDFVPSQTLKPDLRAI